jgi:hypothetical protein
VTANTVSRETMVSLYSLVLLQSCKGYFGKGFTMITITKTAEQHAADLAAFQASQEAGKKAKVLPNLLTQTSTGEKRNRIETDYRPAAKSKEQLLAECTTTGDLLLSHEAAAQTSITARISMTLADMLYLGIPSLGDRDDLTNGIGASFALDGRGDASLYNQLRTEAVRKLQGGEGAWFSREVQDTNTFKSYLGSACRRAVLLAFGHAQIGLMQVGLRGKALQGAVGIPMKDMPDYDPTKYAPTVLVKDNVICPIRHEVQMLRDGSVNVIPGKDHINENENLVYLSGEVADALYALKIEHVGNDAVERDEAGYLLKLKPAKRGTQSETTTTAETKAAAVVAKPEYFNLRDTFMNDKTLGDGNRPPALGALHGIWSAITLDAADVSEEIMRTIFCMARDAAWRIIEHYNKDEHKDKLPPANLVKAMAEVKDVLEGYVRFKDKGGNIVQFRTDTNDKKWKNIMVPEDTKIGDADAEILAIQEAATPKPAEPANVEAPIAPKTEAVDATKVEKVA